MHPFLRVTLLGVAALAPSCDTEVSVREGEVSAREGNGRRPDVLLFLVDTLRADRLGCYGYRRETTPTLDALAERGALFRRASAQAPWTVPSMASLMTGRYPTSHLERPPDGATTLAEVFQGAGYRTLGVVANFVILPDVGFERGFDRFLTRIYVDEDGREHRRQDGTFEDVMSWARDDLERVARRDEDGTRPPVFLYLHVIDPHDGYKRHVEYSDLLPMDGAPPVEPEGWLEKTLAAVGPPPPEDDPGWRKALRGIQRDRNRYDREVRYVDDRLRELFAELEELEIGEDLLTAVVSDHGEELWEHLAPLPEEAQRHNPPETLFFQTHGYLMTEQALRTPFLLAGPGVPAGVTVDAPVENVDLFPTLLELCDIGVGFETHGRSLVPWLRGEREAEELREETFAYVQHGMMIREEATGLKLVLPTEKGLRLGVEPSLHDLEADPLERVNLYDERPADVRRLTDSLLAYLDRYPSGDATVAGEQAGRLREALESFGYAGDLLDSSDEEPGGR